jgi:enterochelin esterase-like enzyme
VRRLLACTCIVLWCGLTLDSAAQPGPGGAVQRASYRSAALNGAGTFLVYLPPGYRTTRRRYPSLYLLHGSDSQAGSFLSFGLKPTLDRLIAAGRVPPMIVVMPQGGPGENDWLNSGRADYEDFVVEVQALVDRHFRTIADRRYRGIGGYSMGGFGAMNIALSHLDLFSVAESWSGFFGGLAAEVDADRPSFARLPLRAFMYGGSDDTLVDSSQDQPFAGLLRLAGAHAGAAVYSGGHSAALWSAHLAQMLSLVGRTFRGQE